MNAAGHMDLDRQADDDTGNNSDVSSGVPSERGKQIKGYFRVQGVQQRRRPVQRLDMPDANTSMSHTPLHEVLRPTNRQVSQTGFTFTSYS
jgi:hypothetical protein